MTVHQLKIQNKRGLHARASAKFVKTVESYNSRVKVSCNGMSSAGNSLMGLMSLGATIGSTIELEIDGDEAVLDALTKLVNDRFDEGE